MRGTQLHAGGQDVFCVTFYNGASGADADAATSVAGVTTTVETTLVLNPPSTGDSTRMSRWTAPWPCAVSEVFVEGQLAGSDDICDFRLRRHDLAAYTTADDIIRNSRAGAGVDYVRIAATAVTQFQRKRYVGIPVDTAVAPYFAITTASSDTATGFLRSERVLAAGDRLSATYKMAAAGDSISHLRCIVTLAKLDSI